MTDRGAFSGNIKCELTTNLCRDVGRRIPECRWGSVAHFRYKSQRGEMKLAGKHLGWRRTMEKRTLKKKPSQKPPLWSPQIKMWLSHQVHSGHSAGSCRRNTGRFRWDRRFPGGTGQRGTLRDGKEGHLILQSPYLSSVWLFSCSARVKSRPLLGKLTLLTLDVVQLVHWWNLSEHFEFSEPNYPQTTTQWALKALLRRQKKKTKKIGRKVQT